MTTSNKYEDLIYYNENAQNILKTGIDKIVNAVKVTLGPFGRNVIFAGEDGVPIITKDGVSVSNYIRLIDPIENMAADILKQVSRKTVEDVGDGTTTSMVLTQALINNTAKELININSYKNYLEIYKNFVVKYLESNKTLVTLKDTELLKKIILTSANQDTEIVDNLIKAFNFTGLDGVIDVQKSKNNKTTVDLESGYRINTGWLSSHFINVPEQGITSLSNSYLLIVRDKLESFKLLMPSINLAKENGKNLIIIAKEFDDTVLSVIAKNFTMGNNIVPIIAEGFNDDLVRNLEDLAVYCDGEVLTTAELKDNKGRLGLIDEIIIKKNVTTIQSSVNVENITKRVAQIKALLKIAENPSDKNKLEQRLSKMTNGLATIKVGGYTESEIKEKFDRYEDALGAMKAAILHGVLPGGGTALYKAAQELKKVESNSEEKSMALDCLIKSLVTPYYEILRNADINTHKIKSTTFNVGYNLYSHKETDFVKEGIIDPFLVTVSALNNAISVATMIITTGCVAKNTETILL